MTKEIEKLVKLREKVKELQIENQLFEISLRNNHKISNDLFDNLTMALEITATLRKKLYRIYGIAKKINMGEGDAQELASCIKKIVKEEEI